MTTTDDITTAETRLTKAQVEVGRLRAVLAAELADRNTLGPVCQRNATEQEDGQAPRAITAADGRAAARARLGQHQDTTSENSATGSVCRADDDPDHAGSSAGSWAAGVAEARRRGYGRPG